MNPMGIEIQRLAQNIESIPREHFCPVCQLLINPNEALQAMCGHLYCNACLTYVARTTRACPYDGYLVTETDAKPLVESNKMLADTIGKTLVFCSYQYSGCTWVGSLADSFIHCFECAFRNSHVMCCWCGTHMAHRQWREHVQVCHGAYNQASVAMATTQASIAMATTQASIAMATTQASAQGHGVSAATLTQEQWYQEPYQQYYQNYIGDYMQQHPMQRQSFAPQNQVIYVQAQPQPQVQPQSSAMHQPHDAFPSPEVNSVQDSLAQSTIDQCQSNQTHASWTELNPQPNQTDQEEAPPNSMFMYHQDHFREQLLKYGEVSVPESSDMHSLQKIQSQSSLPQQQTAASTTGVVHNQTHQEGSSYNPHIAPLQYHLRPIALVQGLQEHPQTFQKHQPIPTILGVQPNMNHFSATAPQVGLVHDAPNSQRIPKQVHWPPLGQDKVLHIYGNKDDEAVMEGLASDLDNDAYNVNRTLLDQEELPDLSNIGKDFLMLAEKSKARSAESLDRGFDQRSSVGTQEMYEPGFDLRHALRSSQPSMDLGEGQFRRGPRSPIISEHLGMSSHGYGPLEGGSALHRSEFKGIGNLQMGDKVVAADMIGPVDSNGLRLGDVGSQSRYPGDDVSFQGDWATEAVESLGSHSQTKEHDEKKHKTAPSGSSQFGNQNKNEEDKFKGPG